MCGNGQVARAQPAWRGQAAASKLAGTMLEVYSAIRQAFSRTDQRHYLFTPRHLSQWIRGLKRYDLAGSNLLHVSLGRASCASMRHST